MQQSYTFPVVLDPDCKLSKGLATHELEARVHRITIVLESNAELLLQGPSQFLVLGFWRAGCIQRPAEIPGDIELFEDRLVSMLVALCAGFFIGWLVDLVDGYQ